MNGLTLQTKGNVQVYEKKTAKIVTNYFPTKFDKYNYNLSNSKKYLTEQSSFS